MSADAECGNEDRGIKTNLETKAHDLMVRGRLLNTEAWIELTECYQRKLDVEGAIVCLENALKYCEPEKPNKVILRKLSTCIRQKSCTSQEEKVATLLRSLELSKQALKTDLNDEENYYNLAKAYMCLFFVTECVDQQLINLSRAAFMKALSLSNRKMLRAKMKELGIGTSQEDIKNEQSKIDMEEKSKPFIEQTDFLFNYATVLVYLQEFQEALEFLRMAIDLDPGWEEPKALEECLVDYLKQIQLMMNELGKNNKKVVRRYSKVVESLKDVSKIETVIQADQQRLKKSTDISIKSITLDDLETPEELEESEPKINDNSASTKDTVQLLHLKLVSTINYNQAMYVTFIAIDQNYSLIVVTIYNLAASRCPIPKDTVTLVDPKIEKVTVNNLLSTEKDSGAAFKRINVREFKSLYVNGYRISTQQVSKPQCKISVMS